MIRTVIKCFPIYNLPIQAAYIAPQVQTRQEPERYAPAPVLTLKIRRWLKLNDLAGIVLRRAGPFLILPSPLTHLFIRLLLAVCMVFFDYAGISGNIAPNDEDETDSAKQIHEALQSSESDYSGKMEIYFLGN